MNLSYFDVKHEQDQSVLHLDLKPSLGTAVTPEAHAFAVICMSPTSLEGVSINRQIKRGIPYSH